MSVSFLRSHITHSAYYSYALGGVLGTFGSKGLNEMASSSAKRDLVTSLGRPFAMERDSFDLLVQLSARHIIRNLGS